MPAPDTQVPTLLPTTNRPLNAGSSLNDDTSRLDGIAKVTGKAKYGRDVYPPNALFVAFIRCPFGAGELAGADVDAARSTPGIVEIQVNDDAKGQYHGHTVGHIVAESPI